MPGKGFDAPYASTERKEDVRTDEAELFLALQLLAQRHWSYHQPYNCEHLCWQHFCAMEAFGANSEDVSIR